MGLRGSLPCMLAERCHRAGEGSRRDADVGGAACPLVKQLVHWFVAACRVCCVGIVLKRFCHASGGMALCMMACLSCSHAEMTIRSCTCIGVGARKGNTLVQVAHMAA